MKLQTGFVMNREMVVKKDIIKKKASLHDKSSSLLTKVLSYHEGSSETCLQLFYLPFVAGIYLLCQGSVDFYNPT